MKKLISLVGFLFLCLYFIGNVGAQNDYQIKKYQFISYDKIPTWKVIIADWNKPEATVHLFDTKEYKGHGNFVSYGMNTGIRFAQFKELVRHPKRRIYLPVYLYDLREMPLYVGNKKHTWALRLEHYNYTDDKISMEKTFIRLMKTMERHIKKQGGNIGQGIALLASSKVALPNKTITKGLEKEGYSTMALYEMIAALSKSLDKDLSKQDKDSKALSVKILNPGTAVGYLRLVKSGEESNIKSNFKNILLYQNLPYRVPIANGIITFGPQTPLSHINLLAKNRGTVNAYLKSTLPKDFYQNYEDKLVKITCKQEDGKDIFDMRLISEGEAKKHWDLQRKLKVNIPKADLSVKAFSHFGSGSRTVQTVHCIGAKATNYALLQHELPQYTRPGFAIPFYYYTQTIKECKADKLIEALLKEKSNLSPKELSTKLENIQNKILTANLDERIFRELEQVCEKNYKGKRIRLRSSTNCEDLAEFNGAGLYLSKGFQQGSSRKVIQEKILKIYASLWLSSAFDERDFFGIDHQQVAMAILINEAFSLEYANGVALTLPSSTGTPSIHINSQFGELSVSNPEDTNTAEIIYFRQFDSKWYVTESKSSVQNVFVDNAQLTAIVRELQKACSKIDILLRKKLKNSQKYGVDIEFKIMKIGANFKLYIKQARLLNTTLAE